MYYNTTVHTANKAMLFCIGILLFMLHVTNSITVLLHWTIRIEWSAWNMCLLHQGVDEDQHWEIGTTS